MAELCAEFAFTKVYYLGLGFQGIGTDSRSRSPQIDEKPKPNENYSVKYFDIFGRLIFEGENLNNGSIQRVFIFERNLMVAR